MLLEFRCKNFKTFREECVFSMKPTTQRELLYSVLSNEVAGKKIKALCSSVIYGPNAAGKSNLIGAMDVFKSIVEQGHIRNISSSFPHLAKARLELIPNSRQSKPVPVWFCIEFIAQGMLFRYEISLLLGKFMDRPFARKIESEILFINEQEIFRREETKIHFPTKGISTPLFMPPDPKLQCKISSNLGGMELFLTHGFKSVVSNDLATIVTEWFREKLEIVYVSDMIQCMPPDNAWEGGKIIIPPFLSDAVKSFGICGSEIIYARRDESDSPEMMSIVNPDEKKMMHVMPVEHYESTGTIRFINILPLFIKAIISGSVLVMDELDVSLHPSSVISLIKVFHNDEINKKNAQLIFNTHNPIYLDTDLFRRDEIKLVDRDLETGESDLYQLSDFGSGPGARKTNDYMKNYYVGRYGAVRHIDFSDVFLSAMKSTSDEKKEKTRD